MGLCTIAVDTDGLKSFFPSGDLTGPTGYRLVHVVRGQDIEFTTKRNEFERHDLATPGCEGVFYRR